MSNIISEVSKEVILGMKEKEGLVCIGTGGELTAWIDGINEILVEEGISENEKYFSEIYTFIDYDIADTPIKCILFPFTEEPLNIGRLAIVRLQYEWMRWLSDYILNYEGEILEDWDEDYPDDDLYYDDDNF